MATAPVKTAAQTAKTAPVSAAKPTAAPVPALHAQNALALPADLMAELAGAAKDAAAKERPSVGRISLKAGVMSYGGTAVPGNNMDVIIIGSAYRNVWYAGRYDANNIVNPNCFAFSTDEETLEAHANVPEAPPTDEESPGVRGENERACNGCSKGAWGSDPGGGRGKACKQTRRLLLLPADVLQAEDVAKAIKESEMAILDVPVTSVKGYANLVSTLSASQGLPVWAAVTNVLVQPDAKTQFKVVFTPLHAAGNEQVIRALMLRREEANRLALQPFDGVGGEADPDGKVVAPAAPMKNKFAAKKR